MNWIKRNLFFVIGAAVALVLMVAAGFYTWSGWNHNAKALEELNGKYEELKRLVNLNPSPGDRKTDNIKAAKEQQKEIREVLVEVGRQFERIHGIPDEGTNVLVKSFANGLDRTIYQLQRDATNASVALPAKYNFSFEAEAGKVRFPPGSLEPLAVQLGEVRAICEVLIAAKVNWLDGVQRERVAPDDYSGPQTDYIDLHSTTNELAVVAPYQVTFRCFTPELAQVLCGFAGSSHGFRVRGLNVEPAASQPVTDQAATPAYTPQPAYTPAPAPQPRFVGEGEGAAEAFARRYGGKAFAPATPAPAYAAAAPAPTRALQTVLSEKQLRVTMLVEVIKLLPKK